MSRRNRIKALIVEDDDKWRNAMAIAMKRLGCEVRQVDDAQLAIEILMNDKNSNVLILDWDLRLPALPTALGEDVLRAVIQSRPDLTVVIVTGALRNPDYTDWRKELFGIDPVDDAIRMANWQPFAIIPKTDLVFDEDLDSELKNGLPALTGRLKERGLLEEVRRRSGLSDSNIPQTQFEAVGPYQFHWSTGRLVAANGAHLTLLPRFERIIREMFEKDPANRTGIKTELTYEEFALKYVEGWGIERKSQMNETKLKAKIRGKSAQITGAPNKATQFASEFRRFLKRHGITDRDAIIKCDKGKKIYRLGESWNRKKPVLDRSEVSLTFQEQADDSIEEQIE